MVNEVELPEKGKHFSLASTSSSASLGGAGCLTLNAYSSGRIATRNPRKKRKHQSNASSSSSSTGECLVLAPHDSKKFSVDNPMVPKKKAGAHDSENREGMKRTLTVKTDSSSSRSGEQARALKRGLAVFFPAAWAFFAGVAHICVALSWPAACPAIDIRVYDDTQGANSVIMFGYYSGVSVVAAVITRAIFMHRCHHISHFHARISAMYAACVIMFLIVCCVEREQYLPICPNDREYSIINPLVDPVKPATGVCTTVRVSDGVFRKAHPLPECRRFTGNSFNNYTHSVYMDHWGTDYEEATQLARVGAAVFHELFNGDECVRPAFWEFFCQVLEPGCLDTCEPVFMCPDACMRLQQTCPVMYQWLVFNSKNVDKLGAWVGNLGPAAKLLEDFLLHLKTCTFVPPQLFGDDATCGWKPRSHTSREQRGKNCTLEAETRFIDEQGKIHKKWVEARGEFYDELKAKRQQWITKQIIVLACAYTCLVLCALYPAMQRHEYTGSHLVCFFTVSHNPNAMHTPLSLFVALCICLQTMICAAVVTLMVLNSKHDSLKVGFASKMLLASVCQVPLYFSAMSILGYRLLYEGMSSESLLLKKAKKYAHESNCFLKNSSRLYLLFEEKLGIDHGEYFMIRHALSELVEILLQAFAVIRSFVSTDAKFSAPFAFVVGINAIGSSLLFAFRKKYACVIFDAVCDIIYVGFNAARFLLLKSENDQAATLKFLDAVSLAFPILSVSFFLYRFLRWILKRRLFPNSARRRKELISLPSTRSGIINASLSVSKNSKIVAVLNFIYATCVACFGVAVIIAGIRTAAKHSECVALYTPPFWEQIEVRIYQDSAALFAPLSCSRAVQKVKVVRLQGSGVAQIGPWIHDFESLTNLSILSRHVSDFTHLVNFSLSHPDFQDLALGDHPDLGTIDWSGLNITTFPQPMLEIIRSARRVRVLNLSHNRVSLDSLGKALNRLRAPLSELDISSNALIGLSPTIFGAKYVQRLKRLNLADNLFGSLGVLFAKWALNDGYTDVNLRGNPIRVVIFREFTGTIPDCIFQLSDSLEVVDLEINKNLFGTIPAKVGLLTNLVEWKSYETNLSGTLPPEFGDLPKLEKIDIANCRHTGTIPASLGRLTNMQLITFDYNDLSGELPQEIFQLSSLVALHLHFNSNIRGYIPNDVDVSFPVLEELSIHGTHIDGSIPTTIGNMARVTTLGLSGWMRGTIPSQIGKMSSLQDFFVIKGDGVFGTVPSTLSNLPRLEYVHISDCPNIQGEIPFFPVLNQLHFWNMSSATLSSKQKEVCASGEITCWFAP